MSATFETARVRDIRVPTSRHLDGSDAMSPFPDYSAAYLELETSDGTTGYGFVFTVGRGNDVQVAAIEAYLRLVLGLDVNEVLADMRGFSRRLVGDSQLRWLGPEKGAVHMAAGAIINAVWDLAARRAGAPRWRAAVEVVVRSVALRHRRHRRRICETRSPRMRRSRSSNVIAAIESLTSDASPSELDAFFGGTACRVYDIDHRAVAT